MFLLSQSKLLIFNYVTYSKYNTPYLRCQYILLFGQARAEKSAMGGKPWQGDYALLRICFHCKNKNYAALDEQVITDHLRGHKGFVAGIYPLCPDETCYFLAIDFDGEEWEKDISVLRDICLEFRIPLSVERSRSGNGAHAWFFFESAVPAALARKLGSALLTHAMTKRHEIRFKSYDRFFPSQDTLPKGGLGNLIALPLQKAARNNHNSVFIDENGDPYKDQWAYLSSFCSRY